MCLKPSGQQLGLEVGGPGQADPLRGTAAPGPTLLITGELWGEAAPTKRLSSPPSAAPPRLGSQPEPSSHCRRDPQALAADHIWPTSCFCK